jgi:hypothetical protein
VSDVVALSLTVVGFAALATAHVAIVFALVSRTPRWHAVVAFFLPPAAPLYAFRARIHVRAALWIVGAAVYLVGLFFVRR